MFDGQIAAPRTSRDSAACHTVGQQPAGLLLFRTGRGRLRRLAKTVCKGIRYSGTCLGVVDQSRPPAGNSRRMRMGPWIGNH